MHIIRRPLILALLLVASAVAHGYAQQAIPAVLLVQVQFGDADAVPCLEVGVGTSFFRAEVKGQVQLPAEYARIDPDSYSARDLFGQLRVPVRGEVRWALCEARCPDGDCDGFCMWTATGSGGEVGMSKFADADDEVYVNVTTPVAERQGHCREMHDPDENQQGMVVDLRGVRLSHMLRPLALPLVDEVDRSRRYGTVTFHFTTPR